MASLFLNNTTSSSIPLFSTYALKSTLCFWLFLVFDVLAILCTIFVLYHLLTKRVLRETLHNHIPILLLLLDLVYELVDIPLHLNFFRIGVVYPNTPSLCLIWWFIDWGFFFTMTVLLMAASFERHILIFHSQLVATRRKRLIFHYFPLLAIVLFMLTFYSVAIFAPICENIFDYTLDVCGTYACYESIPFFSLLEQFGFSTAASCLIAIFSIALFVRVLWQKHQIHRAIEWRKQRKLAVQTVCMSLLYLVFTVPPTTIFLVRFFNQSDWAYKVYPIFFFLSYFAVLLLPFVCLAGLPELWKKVKRLVPYRPQAARVGVIRS